MKNETHLPAKQAQKEENPRFPSQNENSRGKKSSQPPPPSRPQSNRRLRFPKTLKLTTRGEFRRLSKQGQRVVGQTMCIDWLPTSLSHMRLGLTVSTRYGDAHERNLFKRRIREAFRTTHAALSLSLDINVVPRNRAKTATYAALLEELLRLIRSIHVPSQ